MIVAAGVFVLLGFKNKGGDPHLLDRAHEEAGRDPGKERGEEHSPDHGPPVQ